MNDGLRLEGLDGATPLGFLAALGLLDIAGRYRGCEAARLCWRYSGSWVPMLLPEIGLSEMAALVVRDRDEALDRATLQFRYPKREKKGVNQAHGLTPPVALMRGWLLQRLAERDWQSLREVTGLMTELASESIKGDKQFTLQDLTEMGLPVDAHGSMERACQQSSFDFTSRNAQFLDQIGLIAKSFELADVEGQLRDRSVGTPGARTMDWDQGSDTPGALYNRKSEHRRPVLEWLALRGIQWLPVFGSGDRAATTSCRGRRKQGVFVWCVWEPACTMRVAASLLAGGIWRLDGEEARAAVGIQAVFESQLGKAADGYGGIFSPAAVV